MKSMATDSYGRAGSTNHFRPLLRYMLWGSGSRGQDRDGDDGDDDVVLLLHLLISISLR